MPTIDWDKWARSSMLGLPKNRMWGKIRSGEHDENGEPLYVHETKPDTSSMDPELASVMAEHRFVQPAVRSDEEDPNDEHCFCGWVGPHWAEHLTAQVEEFVAPEPEPQPKKAAPKKAAAKKAEDSDDDKSDDKD